MNKCLTSAKVFRISEKSSQTSKDRDYTKCAAYTACDQPTLWPTIVTPYPTTGTTIDPNWYPCPGWKSDGRYTCPPPSTTPITTPMTTSMTTTTASLNPDLPSWSPLTSESESYSEYRCYDDHPKPDHQRCTLGIVVQMMKLSTSK